MKFNNGAVRVDNGEDVMAFVINNDIYTYL